MSEEHKQELINEAMALIDELELCIHYMFMSIKNLD